MKKKGFLSDFAFSASNRSFSVKRLPMIMSMVW
jgi:hypothetical protein